MHSSCLKSGGLHSLLVTFVALHQRRASGSVKGLVRSLTGGSVKSSVGGEDDGGVRGPQRPRGGPEQRRAQERGLDEGGGAHRVAQGQRVGCDRAQSRWGEGAGQEASCQTLGQLLLQGQFGLEERQEGGGGSGRGGSNSKKQEKNTAIGQTCFIKTHGPLSGHFASAEQHAKTPPREITF